MVVPEIRAGGKRRGRRMRHPDLWPVRFRQLVWFAGVAGDGDSDRARCQDMVRWLRPVLGRASTRGLVLGGGLPSAGRVGPVLHRGRSADQVGAPKFAVGRLILGSARSGPRWVHSGGSARAGTANSSSSAAVRAVIPSPAPRPGLRPRRRQICRDRLANTEGPAPDDESLLWSAERAEQLCVELPFSAHHHGATHPKLVRDLYIDPGGPAHFCAHQHGNVGVRAPDFAGD